MSDAEHPYLSTQPPSPLVSWSQQLALSIAKGGLLTLTYLTFQQLLWPLEHIRVQFSSLCPGAGLLN